MVFNFGIRPFEFIDFIKMIEEGNLNISKVNYLDVVSSSFLNNEISFHHFEITCDLAYVIPGFFNEDLIVQINEFKLKKNYSCSVHLPLWGIELASPNKYIRKASIDCIIDAIKLTKPLNPICWVIHATGALVSEFTQINIPKIGKTFMNRRFASIAQNSLLEIIEKTNIDTRKLAVENVEFPFRLMEDCINNLDLSICLDTGHILAGYSGDWDILEFVENYYERIVELHLHDGRKPRIDHKPLGNFDLSVKELFNDLLKRNYDGPIVFELSPEHVNESIIYIKENVPKALI
ncbi:MAG: cobamide remodeling phosphodiesterase CbiR [Candidatus Hodarchaeota archaeon]